MARNAEKAQSMLHRFALSQSSSLSTSLPTSSTRRPKAPSTISSIPAAEKFRSQILRDISRKITKIQDESISDFQIRDLNDEINKLMKEKWGWERRIRELGGPNYMRGQGGVVFDEQGREIDGGGGGGKGYRYFGRARELPGVKEMFERAAKKKAGTLKEDGEEGERREVQRRGVDARYFGYMVEGEERELVKYERRKEREAVERVGKLGEQEEDDPEWEALPGDVGDGVRWALPTLEQVQEELMDRKRRQLLENLG
jgi:hypothetical protein